MEHSQLNSTVVDSREVHASVLVSILNWNGLPDTLTCLSGFAPTSYGVCDIVVIDNGSSMDPTAELQAKFPSVECIRLSENRGFAGGQNLGIKLAIERGYEAVLLLNNDCEISPGVIQELLAYLRSTQSMAAVSPLIYCSDKRTRPQMVGAWLDWNKHTSIRPSNPDASIPAAMLTMVPGTALLLKCKALEEIGLLDERYFAYYEDNDISVRVAKHGMEVSYCRTAKVWHSSRPVHCYSDLALYLSARNAWLFWRENTPHELRRGLFRHLLAQSLYEIAMLKKAGAGSKCKAVTAGFWDGQRRKFGRPPSTLHSPALLRWGMCVAPYFMYELVSNPFIALVSRLRRGLPFKL